MADRVPPSIGCGARLWYNDGSGYEEITHVVSIKVPELQIDKISGTVLASPNCTKQWFAGMIDTTEMEFEMDYHLTEYEDLTALGYGRTNIIWKVSSKDGGEIFVFTGFITKGPSLELKAEDRVTSKVSVQISSGSIVVTHGSSASGE